MLFSFINFNSIPFHSQSNFNEEFDVIKDFIDDTNQNEQFSIVCLNEVYGYRSGIFGFCLNYLSNCIKSQPTLIKNYMNSQCYKNNPFFCDDFDIIASYCSYLNRFIPILNFGYWDNQKTFLNYNYDHSQLKYINNDSQQKLCSFSHPMLDSGCAFISNKIPLFKGFLPLEKSDSYFDNLIHKGIQWNYYEIENVGYIFITFNLSSDLGYNRKWFEIEQIICLANEIQLKYVDFDFIENLHCFIIGDFKIDLLHISNILSAFKVTPLYDTTFLLSYDKDLRVQQNIVSNQTIVSVKINNESVNDSNEDNDNDEFKDESVVNPLQKQPHEIAIVMNVIENVKEFNIEEISEDEIVEESSVIPIIIESYFENELNEEEEEADWTCV
jgi:hypothetical protein